MVGGGVIHYFPQSSRGSHNDVGVLKLSLLLVDRQTTCHGDNFRPAVQIDSKSVETYYRDKFVPQLKQSGEQEVPLAEGGRS